MRRAMALTALSLAAISAHQIREATAQYVDLPPVTRKDVTSEQRLALFVDAFLKMDREAGAVLNPSNKSLFGQGYRPSIGVPNDPLKDGARVRSVREYLIRKLYLDLNAISPLEDRNLESFIDALVRDSSATLICAGEIAYKYDLEVEHRFNFEEELAKVPRGPEREQFKECWLNDAILGAELRLVSWIYLQLFGKPYVLPEKR